MTAPTRYRVRRADVEVLEWTGSNVAEMEAFAGLMFSHDDQADDDGEKAQILTAKHSAWTPLYVGDFVVRGVTGAFFILDADDLAANYEVPVPDGKQPWDYLTGGDEDCYEGGCEDFYTEDGKPTGIERCSHVTPAAATFGDVYVRERLEYLIGELRGMAKRGEDAASILDTLDAGLYEIARRFAEDVPEHARVRDLGKMPLYAEVIAEALAEIEASRAVADA